MFQKNSKHSVVGYNQDDYYLRHLVSLEIRSPNTGIGFGLNCILNDVSRGPNFCRTFKLSDELAWRGVCCSEHNP
jgi:hypothetical protein